MLTTTLNHAPIIKPILWATKTTNRLIVKNIPNLNHSKGCPLKGYKIAVNIKQQNVYKHKKKLASIRSIFTKNKLLTEIGRSISVTDVKYIFNEYQRLKCSFNRIPISVGTINKIN